uniref:Transmembrane protein 14C n=1 Tax=Parascaris univalens TaxID=6257 RepID=A0A915BSG9_PARUN
VALDVSVLSCVLFCFDMADLAGLIFAGLIVTGGVIGYVKAGSTASLASGLAFGAVLGYSAHTNNIALLLLSSASLAVVMGVRFYSSGKIMPAGVVTALSVAMTIRCAIRMLN